MILLLAIDKLPTAQASIVALHYLRKVPLKNIAKTMGVSSARVSQLHHAALVSLKKHLAKEAD